MQSRIHQLILAACLTILAITGCAASTQGAWVKNGPVQAQLVPESASIIPGKPFRVALHLEIDQGWHVYWRNPGDSGLPVSFRWDLPAGFTAGEPEWPYPTRLLTAPLMTYVFERKLFLPVVITAPDNLKDGSVLPLKTRVDWLVCAAQCIPGHAELEVQVRVDHSDPPPNPLWKRNWARLEPKLPGTQSDWAISAEADDHRIRIKMTNPKPFRLSGVYFFAAQSNVVNHPEPQELTETDGGYILDVARSPIASGPLDRLQGVLISNEGWRLPETRKALAIDIPVTHAALPPVPAPAPPAPPLWLVLLFAFLGGLLLNLMPCVLPVLSLKILGFIKQSQRDQTKLWVHGLVFTAGALCTFWALAGVLLFFQAAGQGIGWGFQFQSPWFLGFLAAVFFLFALNLFGVFEFQAPAVSLSGPPKSKWGSVFFNGVLATIAATPCSAPFMGTALGYSLAQPAGISLTIFTCLGLGMCVPYLLLSFFPALLRFLPKPGPWMIHFKRLMGVLMLASSFWLLWVLQIRLDAHPANTEIAAMNQTSSGINWLPYSPELVEEHRKRNDIVFIDFTARWCLTCKVNERLTLNNAAVVKKFRDLGVVPIMADWTLRDDRITKALAQYGKNSIPLYVLYGKNSAEPVILPELITPAIVTAALDKINGTKSQ